MKKYKTTIVFLLLPLFGLFAQENAEEQVQFDFSVWMFSSGEDYKQVRSAIDYGLHYFRPDTGINSIPLRPNRMTDVLRYIGPNSFQIGTKVPSAETESGFALKSVFSLKSINPEWKRVLFVMFPSSEGHSKFITVPLEFSEESIPEGFALVQNFAPEEIAIRFAGVSSLLAPNKGTLVSLKDAEKNNYQFSIRLARRDNIPMDEWSEVYRRTITTMPDSRMILMIYLRELSEGAIQVQKLFPLNGLPAEARQSTDAPSTGSGFNIFDAPPEPVVP